MSDFIPDNRKDNEVVEPTFVRTRHLRRSPRQSKDLNLDDSTFTYDIYKLYEKYQALQEEMDVILSNLFGTDFVIDGYTFKHIDESLAYTTVIYCIERISSKLQDIQERLSILEQ